MRASGRVGCRSSTKARENQSHLRQRKWTCRGSSFVSRDHFGPVSLKKVVNFMTGVRH